MHDAKQNIFLIGPMAAGKSTIGKALATARAVPFYDSDHEIVQQTGAEISLIFDLEGEEGFRKRESEMLEKLTRKCPIVLATGGGAVLREVNRSLLKSHGTIVYLSCSVEQQLKRTRHDTRRPLLQTANPKQKLEQLMEERGPIYDTLADIKVNTEKRSSKSVLNEINKKIDQMAGR